MQGGSTITQQFIKNAYLPRDERTADTVSRKLREAVLAYQLEKRWSKDKILTDYLNTIYFGQGAYGIEMAARTFFGRSARRLTLAQAALLAAVIQNPVRDDPFSDPAAARLRRRVVLDAMREQGMVSARDAAAAARAPLPRRPHAPPKSHLAPYFVEYVISQLVHQFGAATAFGGGLRVYTTLDPRVQRDADRAATAILGRPGDPSVSLVAIDPHTDQVKALVGGRNFARQQFDVAVDGRRQPGSAFKPFALATAIRQGMSPTSVFISEPKSIDLGGGSTWNVSTYSGGYAGKITLTDATVESDNTVYADLSMMVGPDNVAGTAADMGITSPVGDNPSIALGGLRTGVSPLEMANAYATFADGGERLSGTMTPDGVPAPISITRVTDALGKILVRNTLVRSRALLPWQAGLETSILQQVIAARHRTGGGHRPAGRRQDRHDHQLRRCLVLRLHARPGGGRVGGLPGARSARWSCAASGWPAARSRRRSGAVSRRAPWRACRPTRSRPSSVPPVTKRIVCARTRRAGDQVVSRTSQVLLLHRPGARPRTCTFHGPLRVTRARPDGTEPRRGPGASAGREARLADRLRARRPGRSRASSWVSHRRAGRASFRAPTSRCASTAVRSRSCPTSWGRFRAAAEDDAAGGRLCRHGDLRRRVGRRARAPWSARSRPAARPLRGAVTIVVHGSDVNVVVPNVEGPDAGRRPGRPGDRRTGGATWPTGSADALVVSQTPAAGSSLELGGLVRLTLAAQPRRGGLRSARPASASPTRSGDAAEEVARREAVAVAERRQAGEAVASEGASLVAAEIGLHDDHAAHTGRGELVQPPAEVGHPRAEDAGLAGGDLHRERIAARVGQRERAGSRQTLRQPQGVTAHEHLLAPEDERLDKRRGGPARRRPSLWPPPGPA